MSVISKEHLTAQEQKTVDEIALQEVDNYVERVEGTTERTVADNQSQQPQLNQNQQHTQFAQLPASNSNYQQKEQKKILLPIDESNMRLGLKSKPSVGVKWLAEWCLMMIKKYPGRVFYSPTTNYD